MAKSTTHTSELDRLFQVARRDVPSPTVQRNLQSAVFNALRSSVVPSSALLEWPERSETKLGKLILKLVVPLGAIAVVAAGVGQFRGHRMEPAEPVAAIDSAARSSVVAQSVPIGSEQSVPTGSERDLKTAPLSATALSQPATTLESTPGASAPTHAPVQSVPTKAIPSEASLIELAHRQLLSDPKRALALTETHRKLYPKGILSQEREVIAIEALSRLGKSQAAEKRADSFRSKQPHSIHESRIRAVLGDAGVEAHK